jgi:hypothetical protein
VRHIVLNRVIYLFQYLGQSLVKLAFFTLVNIAQNIEIHRERRRLLFGLRKVECSSYWRNSRKLVELFKASVVLEVILDIVLTRSYYCCQMFLVVSLPRLRKVVVQCFRI